MIRAMVDMTDDWMNPKSGSSYTTPKPEDKNEYLIERARKQICFGNPGYIVEWVQWGVPFATAEGRDEAMEKLSAEHPMWHLRARNRNRYREQYFMTGKSHPGINL